MGESLNCLALYDQVPRSHHRKRVPLGQHSLSRWVHLVNDELSWPNYRARWRHRRGTGGRCELSTGLHQHPSTYSCCFDVSCFRPAIVVGQQVSHRKTDIFDISLFLHSRIFACQDPDDPRSRPEYSDLNCFCKKTRRKPFFLCINRWSTLNWLRSVESSGVTCVRQLIQRAVMPNVGMDRYRRLRLSAKTKRKIGSSRGNSSTDCARSWQPRKNRSPRIWSQEQALGFDVVPRTRTAPLREGSTAEQGGGGPTIAELREDRPNNSVERAGHEPPTGQRDH